MTSSLKTRIDQDYIAAMKAKDTRKKEVLVLLRSAIKQREVDQRVTLTDLDVLTILTTQVKQRRHSLQMFQDGGRVDLAEQEQYEIDVLNTYLPQPLSDEDIDAAITQAIAHVSATGMKDMGKVMALLKPDMQGRADMSKVSQLIKQRLAAN
tara:strand:+ start:228 stop:683 length:456 start_codon:yes stop_codon:yes gene_type:complete